MLSVYTTVTMKTTGTTGLEPAASHLTSERSARLSYAPISFRRRARPARARPTAARNEFALSPTCERKAKRAKQQ